MEIINVVPMMACCPISHMGHYYDIGNKLLELPGKAVIGLSNKNGVFSRQERLHIISNQWSMNYNGNLAKFHFLFVDNVGDTLKYAYNLFGPFKDKKINLVVGDDRKHWAARLNTDIRDNKILELDGCKFDEYSMTSLPERDHGLSGTNLRQAVAKDDFESFNRHVGSALFTNLELKKIWNQIKYHLEKKTITVKRN